MARIKLPLPHAGQKTIIDYPARFKWLAAGRRWRKTTMGMSMAVEATIRGQQILWTAPTFDQCRIGWSEMYTAAGGVAEFKIGRMEAYFPNGGRVAFRSLDNPDNARGHTADGIVIDEAPMVKERAWYEVLRPIISDTGGWLLAMGTPRGRNWFWNEWKAAKDDESSASWCTPTLGVVVEDGYLTRQFHPLENPDFPFSEAVKMYNTLPPLTFGQEFLAEFVVRAGLVYGEFAYDTHVQHREPSEFQYWIVGMDEGYTNPAVILLIGIDGDLRFHVAREFYERGKLQQTIVNEVASLSRIHRISAMVVDSSAAGLIADLLDSGLPAVPNKSRVLDGIAIAQNLLRIQSDGKPRFTIEPDCVNTIREFESYTWKEGKDQPVKANDHAMDALRYAVSWLTEPGETEQVLYMPTAIDRRW